MDINIEQARQILSTTICIPDNGYEGCDENELAQRQAFNALMPELWMLRTKGCSFEQLTNLLGQCGLKLQPETVRSFFSEMIEDRQNECIRRTNEQILLLKEIMKVTANHQGCELGIRAVSDLSVAPNSNSKVVKAVSANPVGCLSLQPDVEPVVHYKNVPKEVYANGQMEHPAVPGLMLSKEERLYGVHLEIVDTNGETRLETAFEKRFRLKWQKPIPRTVSSTDGDFIEINPELFR